MKKQLLKDLAELEAGNIITQETAENIRAWYQQRENAGPNRLGIILGILGALLAGSGILLIIAHNWDDLNKLTKTIFAFLPLLAGQALCAYSLIKQEDKRGWKESSAVILFLAIPASIALISQIYQVDGTLSGFLLTWLLLALPLIYIMNSSVVFLLCLATATWYGALVGYSNHPQEIPYLYLLMMIFMFPHYYQVMQKRTRINLLLLMNLFICFSLSIMLAAFLQDADEWYPLIFATYLLLYCLFYFFATLQQSKEDNGAWRPFYLVGLAGILIILFLWSFDSLWQGFRYYKGYDIFFTPLPYVLICGLILLSWLIKLNRLHITEAGGHVIGFSIGVFLLSLLFLKTFSSLGLLVINAWILVIAIIFIRRGSRENHFGILNFGLFILGLLAVCRFFDYTIPFVWRGIFFLGTGIAFFVSNYLLMNKRKSLTTTVNR